MQPQHPLHKSLKRAAFAGLLSILFLLSGSVAWQHSLVRAQTGVIDDVEAQRHLVLGRIYESAGNWEAALQEYRAGAQAQSDVLASDARDSIARISSYQASFWGQVGSDLRSFLRWITSTAIKILSVAVVLLLLGKLVLYLMSRRDSWTVIPFSDLTRSDLGEAVAESIVATLYEARLIHLNATAGALDLSEKVDLPSFSTINYRDALFSSLKAMDVFDVSGIGLPVGSALDRGHTLVGYGAAPHRRNYPTARSEHSFIGSTARGSLTQE